MMKSTSTASHSTNSHSHLQHATEHLNLARDHLVVGAADAVNSAVDAAREVKAEAREDLDAMVDRGKGLVEQAGIAIGTRPWVAVGSAFVGGYLLSRLMRRS